MESVAWAALEVVLTALGRLVVWTLTLGRWRGESVDGEEGKIYGAAGALSFIRDGRRVVTLTGQLFGGVGFLVMLVGGLVLYAVAV